MNKNYLKVNQTYKEFYNSILSLLDNEKPGIYKLYYFEDDSPRLIKRLADEDAGGILYIGMTEGPLINRVCNLQKALVANSLHENDSPASSGHTQMGKKYYRIRKKIKIDDLYIQIFNSENPKQAETDAIENYVNNFGELPPLNGQYGSFEPIWSMFN